MDTLKHITHKAGVELCSRIWFHGVSEVEAGTIPDIVPVSSSQHSTKQSFGWLFPYFHDHLLIGDVCGIRLMPPLFQEQLPSQGVWVVHRQMLGLLCPCSVIYCSYVSNCYTCPARLIGRNKSWLPNQMWFGMPKCCPRWCNISPR